jgi:hypothetical protein
MRAGGGRIPDGNDDAPAVEPRTLEIVKTGDEVDVIVGVSLGYWDDQLKAT